MPINVVRNDITRMEVEAIVNAANKTLLGGGGVDGAIHRAAGEELYRECETLGGCLPGEAKITGGYKLPAKYIIHTVGPVWKGGQSAEEETLRACYRNSLALAKEHGIQSIAFPMISTGHYGYPKDKAFRVQTEEIRRFLNDTDMDVYIVQYERESINLYEDLEFWLNSIAQKKEKDASRSEAIEQLIKILPADFTRKMLEHYERVINSISRDCLYEGCGIPEAATEEKQLVDFPQQIEMPEDFDDDELLRMLSNLDASFSKTLLRLIEEKGLSEVVCYKRANLDRKHFSKIRNDDSYKPSKKTALAFAVALELSYDETQVFLASAGFTLSRSSIFDVIVEYFLREKIYDIDAINATLFDYDQVLLGA